MSSDLCVMKFEPFSVLKCDMWKLFFNTLISEWMWAIEYRLLCFCANLWFYIIYEKQNKNKANVEILLECCYIIGTTNSRTHI